MFEKENTISGSSGPEQWLNTLLESVPFGFILTGSEGRIKLLNNSARELLGIRKKMEELISSDLISHVGRIPLLSDQFAQFMRRPAGSLNLVTPSGNHRFIECSLYPVEQGFLMIIHDVTKEKELEASSIQSLITGQEDERRRLAREIHDGIAPLLSSAKLELDLVLEELKQFDASIPDNRLKTIRQTIDTISVDLRDLSHRLIPRLVEDFGLQSAFKNLVARMTGKSKTQVELYCNLKPEERFDRDIELNLFRCGQELLNNALKHAGASLVMVQVIRHEESIVLMVEDDGTGFDPDTLQGDREGIGLTNVETRVKMLNGEFIVESVKGRGTLVSIEIPV